MLIKCLTVFGLGVLELWLAIPVGFGLGLTPLLAGLFAALGAILSVLMVLAVGAPLRNWLLRLRKPKTEDKPTKTQLIWNKYGIVGLGLLAPVVIGAHFGAAFAVAVGAPAQKTLLWFTVGIVVWAAIATWLAHAGVLLYHN
jgi:uncharacterized membrane protein